MSFRTTPPKRLNPGDTVAIVAPASPFDSEELRSGIDILREVGLRVKLGPTVKNLKTYMTHTGTLQERIDELMWSFTDPSVSGVIVATGGYGCAQLLPYLDYEAIARSRRVLLGMSDIVALQNAILSQTGLISVCGQSPNIRTDPEWHDTDNETFRFTVSLLMSDQVWGSRPFDINEKLSRTLYPGQARGYIVGGNLDTFCHLVGTPYFPNVDGAVLFIEDVHKGGMTISRALTQLELMGVYDRVSGVVIGEFFDVPEELTERDPSIDTVLIEHFKDRGVPCSVGYSFSHGRFTIPVPIGAMCRMDATSGTVSFDFCMGR